ncbi:TetR/AcrR family transcriptional regulator [Lentisphaera profundi]|uniref:TetR/AcrR family transcriptional regulator n=1 Tax=Lentisphaera profundi TaxID=1658616 RepID=A0ABY7VNP1_9BACT|nr:TetR/AcrR family transcriptional regulator [Lentisphaera profundi]WDE95745.1 TetR/AcrR family transcriptional regulator [Lentisphaera profundi]
MAKKQFDRDEVLDRAVALFWEHGFYATSMQQLKESTGLKPGSLYNEFGSKQGLFCEALKHYAKIHQKRMATVLDEAASVGEGICNLFELFISDSESSDYCSCFVIKTQLELAATGNTLYKLAVEMLIEGEALLCQYLEKEYDAEVSQTRAACLMVHIFGIRVYGYRSNATQTQRIALREGLPWLPWSALDS